MNSPRIAQPVTEGTTQIARELDAQACESALWLALLAAQRAGFAQLTDEISFLHIAAGDSRRRLEAGVRR